MSYKLKTLIVFDTNSLRSTQDGEVAYSYFTFGRPFQVVEEFIAEKKLTEDIHIAIPAWAIEELKDQKQRQYQDDILKFQKLANRLSGMPHIPQITLPHEQFDCTTYIQEKAIEYIATKEIKLLEIREELASTILQSMMKRVMKDQNKKHPFAHSGKYKDAGFKDNIVWESLMHFNGVADFDKIIFITKDTDYTNCQFEFKEKWNKHISIISDENNALVEIKKDYELYITEREIYDFAQTEYFKDYLVNLLKKKSEIIIEENSFKIENFKLHDTCKDINRIPPNEQMIENLYIVSEIVVYFKDKGEKKEQIVTATTSFADEESKEIIETFYDFELV